MGAWLQINDKAVNRWGRIARFVVLLGCGCFIYSELKERSDISLEISASQWQVIALVFVLSFANWALEIWRWKFSLGQLKPCGWKEATSQVLAGQCLNWVFPFTGGDLIARLYPHEDRKSVGALIYFNRGFMLFFTIVLGCFGLYSFYEEFNHYQSGLIIGLTGMGVLSWGIYRLAQRMANLQLGFLSGLLGISFLRYSVFTFQIFILLWSFYPDLDSAILLGGIGWTFLFRSVVPSLFGNLGVREASALVYFDQFADGTLVIVPALIIWAINTVLPSAIGGFFVVTNHWSRTKQ